MRIDKEISYLAPEGRLAGTIISGKLYTDEKNGQPRESVRLTIAVDPIHNDPMNDYRVRLDYWAQEANKLMRDATRLIGSKACELTDSEGEILPHKLRLLEGQRVEFTVVHERRPGHKEAFRKVVNLRPSI